MAAFAQCRVGQGGRGMGSSIPAAHPVGKHYPPLFPNPRYGPSLYTRDDSSLYTGCRNWSQVICTLKR
jgi:hypothetical protein